MNKEELLKIKAWFLFYVEGYLDIDSGLRCHINLKIEHTGRVAKESKDLAQDLNWSTSDVYTAEALGCLHDVGRFSQLVEFGTFDDTKSVDHGKRGAAVISKSDVLSCLDGRDRECIEDGIRYHNSKDLPADISEDKLRFVWLIRDADKLDIFHVVREAIERDGFQDLPEMLPRVKLGGPISPNLINELQAQRTCSVSDVRSLSDFLVMQLSWIFDVNYAPTFRRIIERKILDDLIAMLPEGEQVDEVARLARCFVEGKG